MPLVSLADTAMLYLFIIEIVEGKFVGFNSRKSTLTNRNLLGIKKKNKFSFCISLVYS